VSGGVTLRERFKERMSHDNVNPAVGCYSRVGATGGRPMVSER